jgi:DNA primase
MRIPTDIAPQIHDLDILDVVSLYMTVNRKGSAYVACCPFHDEKSASFNVTPSKNIFKCFGCGEGGDGVKFVMKHEAMEYREALVELAEKFNIEIPKEEQTPEEIAAEKHRESIFAVMDAAQKLYTPTIDFDSSLQNFLSERQISQETSQKFGIGYCKEQLSLNTIGWNRQILAECGLEYNGKPVFADRITFPIHNHNGQLVAFTARTLSDDKTVSKYINTKAYQLYNKSEILYNLHRSKNEIRKKNEAILLEGQMDVIGLDQAGIQNTVASSGTAFTEAQAKMLRRFTNNIIIIFDGDKAGMAALEKSLPVLLKYGFNIYSVILPNGQDPDEFIRNNSVDEFHIFLSENRRGFIEQLIEIYSEEYQQSIIGKRQLAEKVLELLKNVESTIEKYYYQYKFSELTRIPLAVVQADFSKILIPKKQA